MLYTLHIDSYGTDYFGCACVRTTEIEVEAKNDTGIIQIAKRRRDVSKIVRPDGTVIMVATSNGTYPFSTSKYYVGA